MGRVFMIRHGKPAATWGDAPDGDPGLDEIGHSQAERARDTLLAATPRPTRVISSPLRRCRETAQPLATALGLELVIDPRVGEIPTPGALAPGERPEWLKRAFAGRWDEIDGDLDYEVWRQAVREAVSSYDGAAVFSHYVALNGVVSLLKGVPQVLAFQPDHASITTFDLTGGELLLRELGREAATRVL